MKVALLGNGKMRKSHMRKKRFGLALLVQHCDRGRDSRNQTMICCDGDAGGAGSKTLAGTRIEEVRVANAVDDHEALVITARREAALFELHAFFRLARYHRFDSNGPGAFAAGRTRHCEVATQIDEARRLA